WARERASTIVAIGAAVEGAALHIGFPHADDPLVSSLVEVSCAELTAGAGWRSVRRMARSYAHGVGQQPLLGQTIGENLEAASARFGDRDALVVRHQD